MGTPYFSSRYLTKLALSLAPLICQINASAHPLPDGNGKAQFARLLRLLPAHSRTNQRKSEAEWGGIVSDMVSRGAQGTQDDFNWVVKYLTVNFGPDHPPHEMPATNSPSPSSPFSPVPKVPPPPGDPVKGKALVRLERMPGVPSHR